MSELSVDELEDVNSEIKILLNNIVDTIKEMIGKKMITKRDYQEIVDRMQSSVHDLESLQTTII